MKTAGKIELKQLKERLNKGNFFPYLVITFFFSTIYLRIINFFFYSDDFHHLLVNKNISFAEAFSFKLQAYANPNLYRPTTSLYFYFLENLFGTNPFPYYLVLFLIGLLTSIFLYKVIHKLVQNKWIATLGVLLFTVFPSHIDPVSWNANICDSLLALFTVISIYLLLRFNETKKIYWIVLASFVLLLALISKEPAVGLIFPLSYLIYEKKETIKQKLFYLIPVMPFVIYVIIRILYSKFIQLHQVLVTYKAPNISGYDYYIKSFFELSARLFLLPNNISNSYRYTFVFVIYAVILLILLWVKQKKYYLFGLLLMVFTIIPSVTVEYFFDRYVFVSGIGLVILVSVFLSEIPKKYNKILYLPIIFILIFLSSFNYIRIEIINNASNISKRFVEKIDNIEVVNLALVPSYMNKKIFKYWDVNQLIISEYSHPREIEEIFYNKKKEIQVKSIGIVTERDYSIKVEKDNIESKGLFFDYEQNLILLDQKAIDSYFNGFEFQKIVY